MSQFSVFYEHIDVLCLTVYTSKRILKTQRNGQYKYIRRHFFKKGNHSKLWPREALRSNCIFPVVPLRPNADYGLNSKVSRSRTTTHHSRCDSSGRVIRSSQRPPPDNTQYPQQTSMPPAGFEPPTVSRWAVADLRSRPCDRLDWHYVVFTVRKMNVVLWSDATGTPGTPELLWH
jgi:hypothetical protein